MLKEMGSYTGKIIEREIFGETEKERPDVFDKLENSYLPYQEAMEVVKKIQPFEPTDPEPRFANDLHATIAERLELADYSQLRFFTAVNSHLDFHHGVDAFFELKAAKKKIIVTLDATTNPQKEIFKADVLVEIPSQGLDPKEDKEEYMTKMKEVTDGVVEVIKKDPSWKGQ